MSKNLKSSVNPVSRRFAGIMGDEKRQAITIPLFALLLSLIAGAIVILLLGKNPLTAFLGFLQGSGIVPKPEYAAKKSIVTDLLSTINALTPMIFAAL
ncbi:MAG: ABC transporter permease, partial [Clostridiales bacterium]|nr:ABC transporter permease [Clostridiales bacterium]